MIGLPFGAAPNFFPHQGANNTHHVRAAV
jgi:hypothetical protein